MNKAELKRRALELRAEIGLTAYQPFDPYALAELYGIDVYQLSDLERSPEALQHFQVERTDVFSGALVPFGSGVVIVENDAHPLARRRSTASHEIAHVALEHPFAATLVNERHCRTANPEHENEASELGGELLLPFDAAKRLARQQASDEEAALQYGVSIEIARWRMNATGARIMARNLEQAQLRCRRA